MNHSAPSIRYRRQRLGIISPQIKNPWTESQRNLLKKLYPQANSNRDLEKTLGHTRSTIAAEAGKLGLRRLKPYRIYSADYQFFQKWTPQMAYVLGFAFGDGNLSGHKYQHLIRYTSKDREILQKIKDVMHSNHKIRRETKDRFVIFRLVISSRILEDSLIELGLSIIQLPEIPIEVQDSFILVYFDADGCIAVNGRISFSSIKENFLKNISIMIEQNTQVNFKKPRKHSKRNIYSLQYAKRESFLIANWLYKNATIYLERKHQRYILIHNRGDD